MSMGICNMKRYLLDYVNIYLCSVIAVNRIMKR